ncbi:MAG: metallophosphoesterase [Candidatus Pacearchaeota archaeon]|jgi:DNA polymerase II small subunit
MEQNILKLFIEKGFLLDREMLDFFNELKDEDFANEIINKIAVISKQKLITKNLVNQNIEKIKPILFDLDIEKKQLVEKFFINISISLELKKETSYQEITPKPIIEKNEIKPNVSNNIQSIPNSYKIISSPIFSPQKLEVKDFVRYFKARYNSIKFLLQQRPELDSLISIDKIGNSNKHFSIIGIVTKKSVTKSKNIILEVEDLSGKTKLLINQTKEEIYEKSKEILLDDIVGFKCSGTRDFLYVNDIIYPDSYVKDKHRSEREVYAVFISDIHVGSTMFLEKSFEKFIDWINGEDVDDSQKEIIKKIKYVFIVGDTIDGVGVYPGQEKFLKIKDIKKQYEVLAGYLKRIPSHITMFLSPGQHDAVRVAEPQPPLGEDFAEPLLKISNLNLVSNPSVIEIECLPGKPGIRVLMYHGASMHPIINEIEELRLINGHHHPAKVVKHLLFRRHLAPIHGSMVYIPDSEEDFLVIKDIPDIITTADLHKTDIDKYNGTLIVCNSCWQSITPFEEKVGNRPDPCKVPILNLQTGAIKILDFTEDGEDKDCIEDEKNISCELKK